MKKIFLIFSIISLAHSMNAQDPGNRVRSIGLFGTGGVHIFSDISSINDALKAKGLPGLPHYMPVYHSGINYNTNRFLFQYSERDYELPVKKEGQYELSASGEGYEIKFGYDLIASKKVELIPYVGIGAHELKWNIDKKSVIGLSEALTTLPEYGYKLSVEDEQLASVGLMINFQIFNFLNKRFNFLLGSDIHYLHSASGRWRLNDQVVDVEDVNLGGFSMMLSVGVHINL